MMLRDDTCYRALLTRDARFDGVFFIGVKTTGIYCRPVCTARTPGRDRVRFFASAALAESHGFRPCLRCRPELAPGQAPVDAVGRTARRAAARIEAGALRNGGSLEKLARELGISSRQLRRDVQQEFGVAPIQLSQTSRLLLAKQLITESTLPMIAVAGASGFESVRRFNALFRSHYGLTPTRMRRGSAVTSENDSLRLTLAYRPPLAWQSMLRFLAARAIPGVEAVVDSTYLRTAQLGAQRGWIRVAPIAGRNALSVELATSLLPVLLTVLTRMKHLFDLSARPDVIAACLASQRRMAGIVRRVPGLRVPGAFDGFELAVRAILGQQISVRAATTLSGRLAAAYGETIETPFAELVRVTPSAERLARVPSPSLAKLGLRSAVAASIRSLAAEVAKGRICLEPGCDPQQNVAALVACPGIGPWTAQYTAMRALRWPDAFPEGDLGLVKASGEISSRALRSAAEAWRPWRAYAAMYLWESLQHQPLAQRKTGNAHAGRSVLHVPGKSTGQALVDLRWRGPDGHPVSTAPPVAAAGVLEA
jgi:AraC family transcriptional regulator, regulatory protein of adaptative response / DNA-3-methyladenine glycosylase II